MAVRNYSSTAVETTLASAATDSETTLAVASATGFPAVPFVLCVDAGAVNQELVLVTGIAGTNLTVTRGYDSTVATAHEIGAVVQHSHAAVDFREANSHVNATAAHGTTGAVVGTTDTQTLTNKTLTSPVLNGELTGTALDWQDWTPAWTGFTVGNATIVARYQQIGATVNFRLRVIAGTTTSSTGNFGFTLPVDPRDDGGVSTSNAWAGRWFDSSSSTGLPAHATHVSISGYAIVSRLIAGAMEAGAVIENGDEFFFSGTYEID